MKKMFILSSIISILFTGCFQVADYEESESTAITESPWAAIQLKDVSTQDAFTIGQFDKPVLIESFAVWCPTCKKQQDEMKALHEIVGDEVISISLDTDPNESEENVIEHLTEHGYDWYYAVSPVELTQGLIEEFGVNVVNAPSAPIILICNGSSHFLESGLKEADELQSHIDSKCS